MRCLGNNTSGTFPAAGGQYGIQTGAGLRVSVLSIVSSSPTLAPTLPEPTHHFRLAQLNEVLPPHPLGADAHLATHSDKATATSRTKV